MRFCGIYISTILKRADVGEFDNKSTKRVLHNSHFNEYESMLCTASLEQLIEYDLNVFLVIIRKLYKNVLRTRCTQRTHFKAIIFLQKKNCIYCYTNRFKTLKTTRVFSISSDVCLMEKHDRRHFKNKRKTYVVRANLKK